MSLAPDAHLSHVYGLSETTFDSTWYDGTPSILGANDLVPIGRSFPGIRTYLLDSDLRPIASKSEGELYIGGTGVARGYRNRPDLTDERFVFSPFVPGDRLFRTGDSARLLPDGTILLTGRLDQQVKVRGFRVDIGEIEAALEAYPGVRQAVVDAHETPSHEKRLIAFYVPANRCDPTDLRRFLVTRLPDFMIPAAFVAIQAVPVTSSGKIDRGALRSIAMPPCGAPQPDGDLATIVAQVVRDVLGVVSISPVEPLTERGLDSLGMSNILLSLEEIFRFTFAESEINPELFRSINSLSRCIDARLAGAASNDLS